MLFKFLKYLQPTHYFSLCTENGRSVYPKVELLPFEISEQLNEDLDYHSEAAKMYDLSWQALNKGYIGNVETYKKIEELPTIDNYRFVRKYFDSAWVLYVLILRLLSLNNPFKEFNSWFKTRHVNRSDYLMNPIIYNEWDETPSKLVANNPKVSVIIPTLNRYDYLKDVLLDFEKQDYKNFEIIIVDQSEPFQESFYNVFDLHLNVIWQEEKALWMARNSAIKNATGKFIALSEDDVRIEKDWISNHLKCIDFFNADISAGVFYPLGGSIPQNRSFFSMASQFATGNALLYRNVFEKIGLFDRQFEKQRMGDGEFGLRAYLNGFKSISNPKASCIDVKASTGGLRQFGSWDAFRTNKLFAPRPIPSVLYLFRKYFGNKQAKRALMRFLPLSIMPYKFKRNKKMMVFGAIIYIIILPFIFISVLRSWNLASKKLNQGDLIDRLN